MCWWQAWSYHRTEHAEFVDWDSATDGGAPGIDTCSEIWKQNRGDTLQQVESGQLSWSSTALLNFTLGRSVFRCYLSWNGEIVVCWFKLWIRRRTFIERSFFVLLNIYIVVLAISCIHCTIVDCEFPVELDFVLAYLFNSWCCQFTVGLWSAPACVFIVTFANRCIVIHHCW